MKLKDLKRGMKCTYRNGIEFIVSTQVTPSEYSGGEIEYLDRKQGGGDGIYNMNDDLTHEYNENLDIMKVEDITLDGYEVIWERKEDKYYLRLPKDFIGAELSDAVYLNLGKSNKKYFFDAKSENSIFQTQFTQEEIDKLDITHLVKEAVE